MQVLNRASEGLKRNYTVLVSPEEIEEAFTGKLKERALKVRMDGFRPGKVPLDLIKRLHGDQIRREAIKELLKNVSQKIIHDEGLLISFDFQTSILKEDDKGVEFSLNFETIPTVDIKPVSDIKLTKYIAEIGDKELNEFFDNIRKNHKKWVDQPEDTLAEDGDEVSVSLSAKIKVKKNEENISTDMKIVIGDPGIMPDFWKPLVGKKAGDVVNFSVAYPKHVENRKLAGKTVDYTAVVKKIAKPTEFELDDDFAKYLGYEDFSKFKEWATTKLNEHYDNISKGVLKRTLLEQMSDMYDFDVPENMLKIEHADVRKQLVAEAARLGKPMSEAIEKGCLSIATSRVRLGFIVAEISKQKKITVSREEIAQEIRNLAAMYPGHEQAIWDTYSKGAGVNAILGPILEDKVVEYLFENITLDDQKCTTEKLKELDEETFDFFKDDDDGSAESAEEKDSGKSKKKTTSAKASKGASSEEEKETKKKVKEVKEEKDEKDDKEESDKEAKKKTTTKKTSTKKD